MRTLLSLVLVAFGLGGAWWYLASTNAPIPFVTRTEVPADATTERATLYYYSASRDVDEGGTQLCSRKGLVPVTREVPIGASLEERIKLLLEGKLTEAERSKGISTEYPIVGLRLLSVEQRGSTAILTFDDALSKTSGGACRVAVLWYQIEETARAYPGVLSVEFRPETLFQP